MKTPMDIGAIASNLRLGADGIWYGSESGPISYPEGGNEDCFAIEDRSFWFRHRNRCITSVVESFPPPGRGTIFDIGGGNGFVSLGLARAGFDVALIEPGHAGASQAKKRGIETVICATTDKAGLKPRSLAAIGLFDVIEHIADDETFLRSMRTLLVEGGSVYATVPAFDFLWSKEDVDAGHARRYSLGRVCEVLRRAGFDIVFASYIFRALPLPIFLLRSLPYRLRLAQERRRAPVQDHVAPGPILARIVDAVFEPEIRKLSEKRPMRFGGSCLVAARAP